MCVKRPISEQTVSLLYPWNLIGPFTFVSLEYPWPLLDYPQNNEGNDKKTKRIIYNYERKMKI